MAAKYHVTTQAPTDVTIFGHLTSAGQFAAAERSAKPGSSTSQTRAPMAVHANSLAA